MELNEKKRKGPATKVTHLAADFCSFQGFPETLPFAVVLKFISDIVARSLTVQVKVEVALSDFIFFSNTSARTCPF